MNENDKVIKQEVDKAEWYGKRMKISAQFHFGSQKDGQVLLFMLLFFGHLKHALIRVSFIPSTQPS